MVNDKHTSKSKAKKTSDSNRNKKHTKHKSIIIIMCQTRFKSQNLQT